MPMNCLFSVEILSKLDTCQVDRLSTLNDEIIGSEQFINYKTQMKVLEEKSNAILINNKIV